MLLNKRRGYGRSRYGERDNLKNWSVSAFFEKVIWQAILCSIFRVAGHGFHLNSKMPKSNLIIDYFVLANLLTLFGFLHWWYVMGGLVAFEVSSYVVGHQRRKFNARKTSNMFYVPNKKLIEYRKQNNQQVVRDIQIETIKTPASKRQKTEAESQKKGLPDFSTMDEESIRSWVSLNPTQVSAISRK